MEGPSDHVSIKDYARFIAEQTQARFLEQVKATTSAQIFAMLNQIIIDAPSPEHWTEQQQKDLSTISFVLAWLTQPHITTTADIMTPDLVTSVLRNIATAIDEHMIVDAEMDALHLRQIADWLPSQQSKEK